MMRLAILMANTDESDFAHRHPRDGEKWRAVLEPVLPGASFPVFAVKDGAFPDAPLDRFDGFIVTGSPASARDGAPWQGRLEAMIREIVNARIKIFGACYGHQAIALALGGEVRPNPGGWQFGLETSEIESPAPPWMEPGPIRLYAAHQEQVTKPPVSVTITARHPACPVAGMRLGNHLFTTQYHPEITPAFMAALLEEDRAILPAQVIARAESGMATPPDNRRFASWIARFFSG